MKLLLTCEHASNQVPPELKNLFAGRAALLKTHRGYDPGAIGLYGALLPLADFSAAGQWSRLVVELNRSRHHPSLFSAITKPLPLDQRAAILDQYYTPFREAVRAQVKAWYSGGFPVLHLSLHTFTPVLDGKTRNVEIGILYDPSRSREKAVATSIRRSLQTCHPSLRVRMNTPYRGVADGHTTALRKEFGEAYMGLELEYNQGLLGRQGKFPDHIQSGLVKAVENLREGI